MLTPSKCFVCCKSWLLGRGSRNVIKLLVSLWEHNSTAQGPMQQDVTQTFWSENRVQLIYVGALAIRGVSGFSCQDLGSSLGPAMHRHHVPADGPVQSSSGTISLGSQPRHCSSQSLSQSQSGRNSEHYMGAGPLMALGCASAVPNTLPKSTQIILTTTPEAENLVTRPWSVQVVWPWNPLHQRQPPENSQS